MNKKELTNEEIVEILNECIENVKRFSCYYHIYLCVDLDTLICDKLELRKSINPTNYISLFTYANALKHANADKVKSDTFTDNDGVTPYVWWHSKNNPIDVCNANRIIFLEWLIEQYSK